MDSKIKFIFSRGTITIIKEHKILGNESIAPYSENKSRYLDSFHS